VNDNDNRHGVGDWFWDDLGWGWRLECKCGFVSTPHCMLSKAAQEFDEHLEQSGFNLSVLHNSKARHE
jgi:hypothetical protein